MSEQLNVELPNGEIAEQKFLENELILKAKENHELYVKEVAKWVATVILAKNRKFVINHDFDPPWDCSGSLQDTGHILKLEDYHFLDDLLDEFKGGSYPSFISGCGFLHYKYDEELEEITRSWISDQLYLMIQENFSDLSGEIVQNIIDEIYTYDLLGDCMIEIEIDLREKIAKVETSYLYKMGKREAMKQLKIEQMEALKKQEEEKRQIEIAKQLWPKVKAMYQLRHSEPIPDYIDKPLYREKVESILSDLVLNRISIEHIRYLGVFCVHPFSNSVRAEIMAFRLK